MGTTGLGMFWKAGQRAGATIVLWAVGFTPQPGQALQTPAPAGQLPVQTSQPPYERITLTSGRSTVLTVDFPVSRIAITNPEIADAVVVEPREILIDGRKPGTVSLIVWGAGQRVQYDIVVDPGVTTLEQQYQTLFPGEDIRVSVNDEAIILSGAVSSNTVMLRAGEIAEKTSSKQKIINLLQLPGGMESQQVMLQVRFAEVNRRAVQELGSALFLTDGKLARITTQQFPAPDFDDGGGTVENLLFSDYLNLFFFHRNKGIGTVIKVLQQKGFFQSLAEPNLIAYNGQEAAFLAGGEIPIPVVQGATGTVGIVWKEFGIRLTFRPTIAGDTIRLKVQPEVSSLDFANGISLGGFRVPALTTRKASTEIELRDGQSFAIAGLLNNISQDDRAAVPILSQVPIIGNLFKSKAERAERTELMVLITPRLVRALDPDEVPPLPTLPKEFLPPEGSGPELKGGSGLVDAPPMKSEKEKQEEKEKQKKDEKTEKKPPVKN